MTAYWWDGKRWQVAEYPFPIERLDSVGGGFGGFGRCVCRLVAPVFFYINSTQRGSAYRFLVSLKVFKCPWITDLSFFCVSDVLLICL